MAVESLDARCRLDLGSASRAIEWIAVGGFGTTSESLLALRAPSLIDLGLFHQALERFGDRVWFGSSVK